MKRTLIFVILATLFITSLSFALAPLNFNCNISQDELTRLMNKAVCSTTPYTFDGYSFQITHANEIILSGQLESQITAQISHNGESYSGTYDIVQNIYYSNGAMHLDAVSAQLIPGDGSQSVPTWMNIANQMLNSEIQSGALNHTIPAKTTYNLYICKLSFTNCELDPGNAKVGITLIF